MKSEAGCNGAHFNPSIGETAPGGVLLVGGQPDVHKELQISQGYTGKMKLN